MIYLRLSPAALLTGLLLSFLPAGIDAEDKNQARQITLETGGR